MHSIIVQKNIIGIDYILIEKCLSNYKKVEFIIENKDKFYNDYKINIKTLLANKSLANKSLTNKSLTNKSLTNNELADNELTDNELADNDSGISRLIPPYNIKCCYSDIDGCVKKSAFKRTNLKYYCWLHIHQSP
jgi:hypothetical protein